MHPRNLFIKDYSYSLPEEKIATHPLKERDSSRLLVYKDGIITEDVYQKISEYIPPNSLIIFNDTKVIEARLLFQKPTGGVIEIFCLEPDDPYQDITTAMLQKRKVLWKCFIGGASKWKHGQVLQKKIQFPGEEMILKATFIEKKWDCFIIELSWDTELSFAELLHHAGIIPLPPYIKRAVESSDTERYQTIYAHYNGSVAAPTAGLHFTERIFKKLESKEIEKDFITLHVGAGTFKPVKTGSLAEHEMHSEIMIVSKETIQNILNNLSKGIIAIGTTSLRAIESLYWLGVKQSSCGDRQLTAEITQWEVYEKNEKAISPEEALTNLIKWMNEKGLDNLTAKTQIIIAPGYQFKIVKGLVTNFHQPQSTLLLLVAAFIGNDWQKVYEYALKNNFRFLSYGDGNLLWRK